MSFSQISCWLRLILNQTRRLSRQWRQISLQPDVPLRRCRGPSRVASTSASFRFPAERRLATGPPPEEAGGLEFRERRLDSPDMQTADDVSKSARRCRNRVELLPVSPPTLAANIAGFAALENFRSGVPDSSYPGYAASFSLSRAERQHPDDVVATLDRHQNGSVDVI